MIAAAVLGLSSSARAAEDWSSWDTGRELTYQGLLLVDCSQTWRGPVTHPEGYREVNPVVGEHPSRGRLAVACIGSSVGHYAISRWLSPNWRVAWQGVTIGAEVYAVGMNIRAGLTVGVRF